MARTFLVLEFSRQRHFLQESPPVEAQPIATIINCSITPLIPGLPFGRITSGTLEIEGLVFDVDGDSVKKIVRQDTMVPPPDPYGNLFAPEWWDMMIALELSTKSGKTNREWEPPKNCKLLPLFAVLDTEKKAHVCQGLVLTEREDGRFERIAKFRRIVVKKLDTRDDFKSRVVIV